MFRDTKRELQRLEQELLQEEETEQQEERSCEEDEYIRYPVDCPVYNTDRTDVDLEEYSRAVREPENPRFTGLLLLALFLMTAIVGILGWWLLRFLGVLQ